MYMRQQGVTALPDSKYKFERAIIFLIALRAGVELDGFTEWGSQCLRVLYGESPSLAANELVMAYEGGRKTEAGGDEAAQQAARRSFLIYIAEEIEAYQKLQSLYREQEIEIPAVTRDAGLLLEKKELKNFLRAKKRLEMELQLKLEQWAAWRRYKRERQAIDVPAGELVSGEASTPTTKPSPVAKRRGGRPRKQGGLKI